MKQLSQNTLVLCICVVSIFFLGCNQNPTEKSKEEITNEFLDKLNEEPDSNAVPVNPITEEDPSSPPPETPTVKNDAPEVEYPSGSIMVNNSYLIIQSTKSYSAAMYTAKQASTALGFPIDYRGYVFDFKEGLKDTIKCGCGEIHEYVPRGRYDDGNYISIEHTNSFTEFTDGYYIVVAASGNRDKLTPLLPKAREFLADAYIKDAEVYIGCMH